MKLIWNVATKLTTTHVDEGSPNEIPSIDVVDNSENAPAIIEDTPTSFIGQVNPRVIQRLIDAIDILNQPR